MVPAPPLPRSGPTEEPFRCLLRTVAAAFVSDAAETRRVNGASGGTVVGVEQVWRAPYPLKLQWLRLLWWLGHETALVVLRHPRHQAQACMTFHHTKHLREVMQPDWCNAQIMEHALRGPGVHGGAYVEEARVDGRRLSLRLLPRVPRQCAS